MATADTRRSVGGGQHAAWRAVCVAVAVAAFIGNARIVLYPLHGKGIAQPLTGALIASAHMLNIPGYTVVLRAAAFPGYHPGALALLAGILISSSFYGLVAYLALRFLASRDGHNASESESLQVGAVDVVPAATATPMNADPGTAGQLGRRAFFRQSVTTGALLVGGGGVVGVGVYSMLIEPSCVKISRHTLNIRGLDPALQGLRIIQLTDFHHGPWTSLSFIERIVEQSNALRPDLVVLTGDYVHASPAYITPVCRALGELRATVGVVGVLGNHDWWEDAPRTRQALRAAGVRLLDNQRLFVDCDRGLVSSTQRGLCVAGVGDYWEDRVDLRTALDGVSPDMPRLVLSHNPDVAEDPAVVSAGARVDLMVSGHTHGGQVRLPVIGTPIVPSRYGQKYACGFVQGPSFRVFVSRGLGNAVLPVRFRVPPEIVVFDLGIAVA